MHNDKFYINHYLVSLLTAVLMWVVSLPSWAEKPQYESVYPLNRPVTIGLDANYAPLQSVDEDGIPRGYDIDFTKVLMKRLGLSFYYVPNPWNRVATAVLQGETDLAMMVYSAYRRDTINYSRPIFRLYYQVVYRKSDYKNFDFRNIKGKTFAYLSSRPVGELMDREGGIGVRVVELENTIKELAAGKYDAVICYRYQAQYLIDHYNLGQQLKAEDISLQPREYCYVSHNKALIDAISQEIEKMEAEGVIDEIYGNKIKPDFDGGIPEWVWYLFAILAAVFLLLYFVLMFFSRRRLKRFNAMLETSYNILEMSHQELEETNRELIKANERAEESSKMKTNFIQQISHEIRTPLNILSGFTQVLTSPDMDLSDEELANVNKGIVENTDRITRLVNKMLELSDASSRTVIERTDNVPVIQIAAEAIDASKIADSPGLTFDLQIAPDSESLMIQTHLRSAVRALTLILDNARKFAVKGQPQEVKLITQVADGMVQFIVEDNGIGVPPEEAEHIFDEFVQLDEYFEGTGIGLTVARSMARRMGGDIVLDTAYSPGARFIMTLPTV